MRTNMLWRRKENSFIVERDVINLVSLENRRLAVVLFVMKYWGEKVVYLRETKNWFTTNAQIGNTKLFPRSSLKTSIKQNLFTTRCPNKTSLFPLKFHFTELKHSVRNFNNGDTFSNLYITGENSDDKWHFCVSVYIEKAATICDSCFFSWFKTWAATQTKYFRVRLITC